MFYRTAHTNKPDHNGHVIGKIVRSTPLDVAHGVCPSLKNNNWRTKNNNKPLQINRNASVDTSFCL